MLYSKEDAYGLYIGKMSKINNRLKMLWYWLPARKFWLLFTIVEQLDCRLPLPDQATKQAEPNRNRNKWQNWEPRNKIQTSWMSFYAAKHTHFQTDQIKRIGMLRPQLFSTKNHSMGSLMDSESKCAQISAGRRSINKPPKKNPGLINLFISLVACATT